MSSSIEEKIVILSEDIARLNNELLAQKAINRVMLKAISSGDHPHAAHCGLARVAGEFETHGSFPEVVAILDEELSFFLDFLNDDQALPSRKKE